MPYTLNSIFVMPTILLGDCFSSCVPVKSILLDMKGVETRLRNGDLIKLRAYKGKSIIRRFLGTRHSIVLICSDAEYQLARREKRKPFAVGFQLDDVIDSRVKMVLGQRVLSNSAGVTRVAPMTLAAGNGR